MMQHATDRTRDNVLTLMNPAGLYDPAPNGYSHVARIAAGARLVYVAGQGGETETGFGGEKVGIEKDGIARSEGALHDTAHRHAVAPDAVFVDGLELRLEDDAHRHLVAHADRQRFGELRSQEHAAIVAAAERTARNWSSCCALPTSATSSTPTRSP